MPCPEKLSQEQHDNMKTMARRTTAVNANQTTQEPEILERPTISSNKGIY